MSTRRATPCNTDIFPINKGSLQLDQKNMDQKYCTPQYFETHQQRYSIAAEMYMRTICI